MKEFRRTLKNFKNFRFYDVVLSLIILFLFCPVIVLIFVLCWVDTGKPLFIQKRVGKDKKPFYLFKFRTMFVNTPSISSHLINKKSVTKFGSLIRILKFDELPQLFNVIKGDMSLIGPRPCLFNQEQLIREREFYKIFSVKPGITGLAQIKGIDMSQPIKLAKTDLYMINNLNNKKYFAYLFLTLFGKGRGDKINPD